MRQMALRKGDWPPPIRFPAPALFALPAGWKTALLDFREALAAISLGFRPVHSNGMFQRFLFLLDRSS